MILNIFLLSLNFKLLLISSSLSFFFLFLAKSFFFKIGFVDIPNQRSSHKYPVALGGGIIIIPIIILISIYMGINFDYAIYMTLAFLFLISIIDDISNINAIIRLFFHLFSVFIFVNNYLVSRVIEIFPNLDDNAIISLYVFSVLAITWFINGFNFMDGIDGITAIQVIYIMISLAVIEILFTTYDIDQYLIILGVMISFLFFNWQPAKIFLGDSGSIPLGFLIIYLLIEISLKGFWVAAIILPLYYILDTTTTLFLRLIKRKKVWKSHKEHFYQIVIKSGKSHASMCFYIFLISMGLFLLSILSIIYKNNIFFLVIANIWCLMFIYYFSKFKKSKA